MIANQSNTPLKIADGCIKFQAVARGRRARHRIIHEVQKLFLKINDEINLQCEMELLPREVLIIEPIENKKTLSAVLSLGNCQRRDVYRKKWTEGNQAPENDTNPDSQSENKVGRLPTDKEISQHQKPSPLNHTYGKLMEPRFRQNGREDPVQIYPNEITQQVPQSIDILPDVLEAKQLPLSHIPISVPLQSHLRSECGPIIISENSSELMKSVGTLQQPNESSPNAHEEEKFKNYVIPEEFVDRTVEDMQIELDWAKESLAQRIQYLLKQKEGQQKMAK